MRKACFIIPCSLLLFHLFPLCSYTKKYFNLITPEEAAKADVPYTWRGPEFVSEGNGPQVKIVFPKFSGPLDIPFTIEIIFEASSGKVIDYDSFRVKYVKLIPIDLTGRLKPYLRENRLIVEDVKVPTGKHRLHLFISYTSGERTDVTVVLNATE